MLLTALVTTVEVAATEVVATMGVIATMGAVATMVVATIAVAAMVLAAAGTQGPPMIAVLHRAGSRSRCGLRGPHHLALASGDVGGRAQGAMADLAMDEITTPVRMEALNMAAGIAVGTAVRATTALRV